MDVLDEIITPPPKKKPRGSGCRRPKKAVASYDSGSATFLSTSSAESGLESVSGGSSVVGGDEESLKPPSPGGSCVGGGTHESPELDVVGKDDSSSLDTEDRK